MMPPPSPNRLRLDGAALVANWHALAQASHGAACGAAVKADGYGLGAQQVVRRLAEAGCRDFFVATWAEAAAIATPGLSLSVLHGVRTEDMAMARGLAGLARPVLNTAVDVARWRDAGGGACDVMIDTGMNRLGLGAEDVAAGLLSGLTIDTLMSHLASADSDSALNQRQRDAFAAMTTHVPAQRYSLANSAGIMLGADYAFGLTRPGLALYGGIPRAAMTSMIRPVVTPEAQVVQRRRVPAGHTVGYGETWTAARDSDVAIINLGYADGYPTALSNIGTATHGALPVIGRVSMDLIALDVTGRDVTEGDWIALDFDLPTLAAVSGRSQYELLTGLGQRFDRIWS